MISRLKNGITRDRHTTYLFPHPFRKKDIWFYPKRGKLFSFQLGEGSQLRNHKNARHYVTRLSYLQQQVVNGTIKFKEIHTKDQIADVMTKPLSPEAFGNFSRTLVHKLSSLYPENQSKGTTQ